MELSTLIYTCTWAIILVVMVGTYIYKLKYLYVIHMTDSYILWPRHVLGFFNGLLSFLYQPQVINSNPLQMFKGS